jgi:CDP-6-deoxy-D-xylo-4-hexulose-3-dehydrase
LFKSEYLNNDKLKKFVDNDLMLLCVRSKEIINSNDEYVYDFCVPNTENFVGGWQPICLHNSTIEGGMVCTDNYELYNILKSIRAHGWNRDLDEPYKSKLKEGLDIDDFKDLYTFYYPGFNLRSTDLQAFIGIHQLDKIDANSVLRQINYELYQKFIKNDYWKITDFENCKIANFAYPIIHPNIKKIAKALDDGGVDCRPLVCGSIGNQPYWINIYGKQSFDFADIVDKYGLYVPNNPDLKANEIFHICDIINENI